MGKDLELSKRKFYKNRVTGECEVKLQTHPPKCPTSCETKEKRRFGTCLEKGTCSRQEPFIKKKKICLVRKCWVAWSLYTASGQREMVSGSTNSFPFCISGHYQAVFLILYCLPVASPGQLSPSHKRKKKNEVRKKSGFNNPAGYKTRVNTDLYFPHTHN